MAGHSSVAEHDRILADTPGAAWARASSFSWHRVARLGQQSAWGLLLFTVLGFLVIFPCLALLVGALTDTNPVERGIEWDQLSPHHLLSVLSDPHVQRITFNTLLICALGTAIAVAVGMLFAWIIVRTDTPWQGLLKTAGMLPLFVPPLVAGIAWSLLGSPSTGLLNVALASLGASWRFDFYSIPGIVTVFGLYYAPYVYLFVASALRNMDPSLEEAAQLSGATMLRTLMQVTLPLALPAIVAGGLLSFVVMLGTYGIPGALGTPAKIAVLTTYLYELTSWTPPLYNKAAAVAILLIVVTTVFVLLQQRLISRNRYVTVSGKSYRPRRLRLGRWRYLTLALGLLYLLVVAVLPTLALAVAAFKRFPFVPDLASLLDARTYTWIHFERLFANPLVLRSIVNTLEMAVATAAGGGLLAVAVAITIYRTRLPWRRGLDLVASLPMAIPGLVIGVGYLWAWIRIPGGFYGTLWILELALIARFLPDAVKTLSTSLMQIHEDLEHASRVAGRGVLRTLWSIVLPLARPGVVAALSLLFILAVRELGSSLFLFNTDTIVMAVLLLNLHEGGNLSPTAAFSLVQIALLLVVIGCAQWLAWVAGRERR